MIADEGLWQEGNSTKRKMRDYSVTHDVRRVIWSGWKCFCATEMFVESHEYVKRGSNFGTRGS